MATEPQCPGTWFGGRNRCPCGYCAAVAAARTRYIDASEQVHRLVNRGAAADSEIVRSAEAARDRAGAQWERAYAGEET